MDTSLLVALVCAVISTFVAAAALVTDRLQWGILKYIKTEFDVRAKQWEQNGTFGEQLNSWLFAKEKEGSDEPTNLELITDMIGSRFYHSVNASLAGARSGDVRLQKAVDNRVFDAVKDNNPELKLLTTILEKLGLGDLTTPELLPLAASSVQKLGLFNNGGASLSKKGELGEF